MFYELMTNRLRHSGQAVIIFLENVQAETAKLTNRKREDGNWRLASSNLLPRIVKGPSELPVRYFRSPHEVLRKGV